MTRIHRPCSVRLQRPVDGLRARLIFVVSGETVACLPETPYHLFWSSSNDRNFHSATVTQGRKGRPHTS